MTDRGDGGRRGYSAGMIIGGVAAVLALIFIVQNTEEGTVQFLAWDFTFATWVWALILFLLGAVTGYFFHWSQRRR